jgi:hypothetical protein
MIIAYMMFTSGKSSDECLEELKKIYDKADINISFAIQLRELGEKLKKEKPFF